MMTLLRTQTFQGVTFAMIFTRARREISGAVRPGKKQHQLAHER
jgi:hypothetical protein